jgi:hypothetical protein
MSRELADELLRIADEAARLRTRLDELARATAQLRAELEQSAESTEGTPARMLHSVS